MGIKYNIYKYFSDKNKLKEITQDKLDNLRKIMERFEIHDVVIDENYAEGNALKKVLNKFILPVITDGTRHIVITDAKDNNSTNTFHFSIKDFLALLETPGYIVNTQIPRIFNTLENIYDNFLVVGQGTYADTLYSYLSGNSSIRVRRYNSDDMDTPEFSALLDESSADLFVIVADLRPYRQLINSNGQQLHTFYLRRLYAPFGKITEYLLDLNQFILPQLRSNGVKVIWIYTPEDSKLNRQREIRKKLRYWERLRRYTPSLFDSMRSKHEHNAYLQSELNAIINDNTRGYSTNYHNGKYINFDNGFRRTTGNTNANTNNVYVFGPCFVRGSHYEDSQTIPSIIKSQLDSSYNVYNMGSTFHTINLIMREKTYKPGDIVVIFGPFPSGSDNTVISDNTIDLTEIYNSIKDIENHIFDITVHFDQIVAKAIADRIVVSIRSLDHTNSEANGTTSFGPARKRIVSINSISDKGLITWLSSYQKYIKTTATQNGAIVMNCNPFTRGHRYLIEQASSQVDNLFIFVVEENKSEFTFEDRIDLVKQGTQDLANVIVLPSGKYVISAQTLPGYFDKKNLGTVDLDAQNDLEYFLSIAQFFGITIRFAGEEPLDMFTNQYNSNMREMLPKYGVNFIEIPRKQSGQTVISASAVRKAIHEGNWDLVHELVPETTYKYLVDKYQ